MANNTTAPYIIGIDLGGTNIKGALLNRQGQALQKISICTEASRGPEMVIERIVRLTGDLIAAGEIVKNQVAGIGIGIPGQIDYDKGKVLFAPNLGWHGVVVKEVLAQKTGLPVYIDNDGNVAALGEIWCGAGRGCSDLIAVTIGTGIGGGMVLGRRVIRGRSGSAAEIGHMIMQEKGPLCNCGKRGCLEALSSATAMKKRAREAIAAGKETGLAKITDLTVKDIFAAAEKGDAVAREIIERSAYFLGVAVANLLNVINPELVVIGGGVSKAGDVLLIPIRETAMANALEVAAQSARIEPARLGNDAGSIGAGALVLMEQGTMPEI